MYPVIMLRAWPTLALIPVLLPAHARAEPAASHGIADRAAADPGAAGRANNRVNLRVGGATTDTTGRPTICLEVRAVAALSIETCGTGSGILHEEAGGEMAHFRAKWLMLGRVLGGGQLRVQGGLGFAELQLDADEPGFVFGPPRGAKIEAAGPEGALSLSWLRPMAAGWELIASTTGGLAWIPHADELIDPQSRAAPFVSFELGIGW